MSSPFQKAFSAKSPLHNHGDKFLKKAMTLSKKGGQGQGGYDYENDKVMKLKDKGESLNAEVHSESKDQTNLPSTADDQQSVINMNSPEKKTEAVADNNKKPLSPSEQKLMHATQSVTSKAILGQEYPGKVGAIITATKNGSVNQMRSPLHGDYYNPKGEQSTILSDVNMIQNATNAVASAGATIDAKDRKRKLDKKFAEQTKDMPTDSAEYKEIYTNTYGAIVPTEKTE